jgi:disulfide bond formation protein DsbB
LPYCIFQRVLYLVIGGLALLGFMVPLIASLSALAIGGLALLGSGSRLPDLDAGFSDLAPECGFTDPDVIERLVDWLGMEWHRFSGDWILLEQGMGFLGLSMATVVLLLFAGLRCMALLLAKRKTDSGAKKQNPPQGRVCRKHRLNYFSFTSL